MRMILGFAARRRSRPGVSRSGSAAVTALLFLAGSIAVLSFVVDSTRMSADAAQLKHATDAAATGISLAYAKDKGTNVQELAERYIKANLGFDDEQLAPGLEVVIAPFSKDDYDGFRVSATFRATPSMLGGMSQPVTVSSAAVAVYNPMEVAVVIPNSGTEDASELAALRRLTKGFAERLIEDKPDRWMALVPYSQTVNVYDRQYPNRIRKWARPGALKPVELTSLFRSNDYGVANLASRMMPNQRTQRLDVYRGLHEGENYFWTEPPSSAFKVRYRADLPANAPSLPYVQWTGPNPMFGKASGTNDTRYIVADKGCPEAALLPLTNDMDEIEDRLNEMKSQFNINFAIAMGWGAMALSPAFRGTGGWGDADHPLDFSDEGNTNIKAIVMMGNTAGDWFDTDAYNFDVGENMSNASDDVTMGDPEEDDPDSSDSGNPDNHYEVVATRFRNLCNSFQEHGLKFYFIGVRSGDPKDVGGAQFDKYAYPQLRICGDSSDDVSFIDSDTFVGGEGDIKAKLEQIASSLESESSFVWLVE